MSQCHHHVSRQQHITDKYLGYYHKKVRMINCYVLKLKTQDVCHFYVKY